MNASYGVKHGFKEQFTCINLFNPHNNPFRQVRYYFAYFSGEETEIQRDQVT